MTSNQKHLSKGNPFATGSSINSVYVERDDEKRKITIFVPTYIYMNVYNASQIKIQERNIALHASIKVKFYTQGISEYLSSEQILKLLGIQQQDLFQIDLQKLYSPKYSLKNSNRKKITLKFGLNTLRTPELAPNTISDMLSLKKLLTLEINQKISFTVQQPSDWYYRYLYIFTPTYVLNLQETMMVQNLQIPINFTNPINKHPYTIQYSFNFMDARKQSQKFNIHPKLLETFGQYQVANNLISIHFSNLKQNKQYLNQRKTIILQNQSAREKQKYLSDYDQFSSEFLDLQETVEEIRKQITGYSEQENDGLIQNVDFQQAKDRWKTLYQKHDMQTRQALRYSYITAKSRQSKIVTFRNWKFAHFQIPIYRKIHRDVFTVLIPLTILAIIVFFFYWVARAQSSRQAFAQTMITSIIIISNALVPISRLSKPPIIGIGFYEILIFASTIPPVLLLLYIGVTNTDEQLAKSFEETERVRSIYMIVAFSIQSLIIVFLFSATIFYLCLRRRESFHSKRANGGRTCCLDYHFLRVQYNQNPHGKLFNLKKWYNNECCRNFVLYGKKKMRQWNKQYINRRDLNIQNNDFAKKQFIKLPFNLDSQNRQKLIRNHKNQVPQDAHKENPSSQVGLK